MKILICAAEGIHLSRASIVFYTSSYEPYTPPDDTPLLLRLPGDQGATVDNPMYIIVKLNEGDDKSMELVADEPVQQTERPLAPNGIATVSDTGEQIMLFTFTKKKKRAHDL